MAPFKTKYTISDNVTAKVTINLKQALQVIDDTRPMMHEIALLLHGDASLKLQKGSRSGTIYRRGKGSKKKKKFHQASADGENPKSDQGVLLSSLRFRATKRFAVIGTNKIYAEILEDDLNRPWLNETLDEAGNKINRIIANNITRAIS